ncbi:LPD1 domain-containing protein [Herbaspirillum seropedicae]|uniref:LPD1 domain-containing protein n=1 Tax=Herbaspirillum seropedicae TaxID=964 RepID=UPI0028597B37|nr:LPD1 domain-containing protein [Herbaspirillum seropedicae]MDR6398002.1 hypothetical protein [Herbaspirillum seropedicae]
MPKRRWIDLARYDGAEALIAVNCPPDQSNRLVFRGFHRNNLSKFGFEQIADGVWLGSGASFTTAQLREWFPGFDPQRDIKEVESDTFVIGYEDLDHNDDETLDIARQQSSTPSIAEQAAAVRRSVDVGRVAAILAEYPLEFLQQTFKASDVAQAGAQLHALGVVGINDSERAAQVEAAIGRVEADLVKGRARFQQLHERALDAISDSDILVTFNGDPLHALRGSLQYLKSTIEIHERNLQLLRAPLVTTGAEVPVEQEQPPAKRARKNPDKVRERIEDAGEKIGGARKDFYKSTLSVADLEGMNDRERLELVKKENIWPIPDFDKMRANGVDARIALFIHALRRDTPPAVTRAAEAHAYTKMVSGLRAATDELKSFDDLHRFHELLAKHGLMHIEVSEHSTRYSIPDELNALSLDFTKFYRFKDRYIFNPDRGYRAAKMAYEGSRYTVAGVAYSPRELNSEQFYEFLNARKMALADARRKTQVTSAGDEQKLPTERPHLAKLVRSGAPEDRDGTDVHPDRFLSDFGFRGVEFGNWLPQDERQEVLNRAYDAFTTLSLVLGVDKQALSLGGTLALGFGSRGRKGALAHYEPSRTVVNLTRLNGAGSLAHEFFHGLDDYCCKIFKKQHGLTLPESVYYASEMYLRSEATGRGTRVTLVEADTRRIPSYAENLLPLANLVNSFAQRPTRVDEVIAQAELHIKNMWLQLQQSIREIYLHQSPQHSREELQELTESLSGDLRDRFFAAEEMPPMAPGEMHPFIVHLRGEVVPRRGCEHHYSRHMRVVENLLATMPMMHAIGHRKNEEAAKKSSQYGEPCKTTFLKNAELLDQKRQKPYWGTVRELAARAFESYIEDRCRARGWRDDYLVHGTLSPEAQPDQFSIYPQGVERALINESFDNYLEVVREVLSPAASSTPKFKVA